MAVGHSYKDPIYDQIEARLERKHGLPAGLMNAIRTKGERSNADQVSPVGARTVYQIMPDTRRLFSKKYGVDAYASKEGAAEVAALHLKESFQRGGDWNRAVREYHGGPDPRKWGKENAAYVGRAGVGGGGRVGAGSGYSRPDPTPEPAKDFSGDWLNMTPGDLSERPLPEHVNSHTREADRQRALVAMIGRDNLYNGHQSDTTNVENPEIEQREATTVAETSRLEAIGVWDKLSAGATDNSVTSSLLRGIEEANPEAEEGFGTYYMGNIDKIESFAQTSGELAELRETNSELGLQLAMDRITRRREVTGTYINSGTSTTASVLYGLAGGILDPAGWAAGVGVGKAFQLMGVGARALYMAGRPIAGTSAMAAEGTIGNLTVMGAIDAAGDTVTSADYAGAAAFGAGIGTLMAPLVMRGARVDTSVEQAFAGARASSVAETTRLTQIAENNLGHGASVDDVVKEVARLDTAERADTIRISLAPVGDDQMMLSSETLLTAEKPVKDAVEYRHGLDGLSDTAERGMITEMTARAERMDEANPINADALNPATLWIGQQSTGVDLLRSSSVVARALGRILTEGTTGAGGRRRTAAMSQVVRERLYNQELVEFTDLYHLFRKEQGRGILREAWDGKAWKEFEKRVFMELERRGDTPDGTTFDANPAVRKAADNMERGFNKMRVEQQHVDTVGAARLGTTSRGYVPHKMLGANVLKLSQPQQRNLRGILSRQFQENTYQENVDGVMKEKRWDKEFSDKLAKKYLEQAKRRAQGGYDVPMNLHTSEAADIVRDSLEAMKIPAEEIEKLLGKYSRGGAGHTKKRMTLNLDEDIGEGMKLADLFDTSVSGLYRGYARRVSGEVALAQYGIMGKKGLMLARTAIESTGGDATTLRAFDQVAAELLNTPFGDWNHKYMDNIRIATSLSRLGGMGFTQLGEYGNGIAALGVHRTFAAIGSLPRLAREIRKVRKGEEAGNPILGSLDTLGGHLGLDDYALTRLFDVRDNDIQIYGTEQIGLGTRLLRAGGNVQAMVSGHRMIVGAQTRGMAEQIIRKAVQYARSGGEDVALRDMGLTDELQAALRSNMGSIATFKGDTLETLDLTKGNLSGPQIMAIRDAIERGASQIIQRTYTGETGKWAHNGFLKMLFQFRTFSLTAVEKQWGRNRANYGAMRSVMTLMGAMSFAAPIHMARVQAKMAGMGDKEAEEYADRHLTAGAIARATLNYASAAGLAGDVLDVGAGFAAAAGGEDLGTSIGARGALKGNVVGGMVAPGVGLIEDVNKGLHGDTDKLFRALPFANLPYLQPAVNVLSDD